MAKIIGNLNVGNNITAAGKNVARTVNNTVADTSGNVELDMNDMNTTGAYGDTFIINDSNTIISDTTVKYLRLTNSYEVSEEKNNVVSWAEVFNSWYRFSQSTNGVYPASPSELLSWSYNSTNNQIYSTTNSTTYIGLVSPERYDNYVLEVNLSSTDQDDDYITLVLAFTIVDGKEYTISAVRAAGGQNAEQKYYWAIVYNYGQFDTKILANNISYPYTIGGATGGWRSFPNGTNIKSTRVGNVITASTTDFSDVNTYIQEFTVDLTSDPVLAKFINPCKVGYGCFSQASSTFKTLAFSGGNIILDIDNNQVWKYNFSTATWDLDTSENIYDYMKKGYIYVNERTKRAFTLYDDSIVRVVAGVSTGTVDKNQVPSMDSFKNSKLRNGYQQLPSGIFESWGYVSALVGSEVRSITLPIEYSSIYNIQCTVEYESGLPAGISIYSSTVDSTHINVVNSSGTTVNVYYRVTGAGV